ncbi:transcriptional regulator, CdaR family [Sporobacter termitidis DSM 10068]|uniref:Transcriptional regulator, CdaR family n=1 Tax=Sporobacter termitidis DSM 10068 TaxID=1123282 RepID=A0A1M5YY31_9FIRM|nr:PucR family transcriptional regulator [Sporobacter termitidis]SHI16931.1 transcriptional regulator, CdaR family [Sporobacter termitidis DSM 10068]
MKINLQIIYCRMPQNAALHIASDSRELLSARLLTPKISRFDRSAVYIGKTSDILALRHGALPENMICVGKGDVRPLVEANMYNVMVLEGVSVIEAHNRVQDIFDYYNQIDSELVNAVLQEKELQPILDICTRFFDNPVYIIDAAQKLISCSSNLIDAEWNNLAATGYVGVEVVNSLKKLDQLGRDAQLVNLESIPPFLSVIIYDKSEKVGSVGVRQLYSKVSENQLSLLKYVAEVLTAAVGKENYARYVKAGYMSRFMIDMLKDTDFEVSFIMHSLSQISWKIDDDYYIFKIMPDPQDITGGTVKYSGELMKNMFPGSVLLSVGDVLALVVNTRLCRDALPEAFVQLEDFLVKRNFICGVSMMFKDFSRLYEQYKLAGAAIELGGMIDRQKNLFRYEDYIMPHMISLCDETFNVGVLCHASALRLHEYDRQTGNNYFYCLYVYLLNEKSLLLSSKQLNIHRSTLIYRLNKISEIISADLSDQHVRMHLILSYEILHFLDCLKG